MSSTHRNAGRPATLARSSDSTSSQHPSIRLLGHRVHRRRSSGAHESCTVCSRIFHALLLFPTDLFTAVVDKEIVAIASFSARIARVRC